MAKRIFCLILVLGLCPWVFAEETTLQDQINAVKEQISEQEQLQEQLRADLNSKDEEIARLKEQLEELEKQINTE